MSSARIEKQPGCQDDYDPASLPPASALDRIRSTVPVIGGTEKLQIRSALNRVLAEDLFSNINVPSGTNSAMDGYAVNSKDLPGNGTASLGIAGTSWAGKPFSGTVDSGNCVRIMTGAILPKGTDTVVIQENVVRDGDNIIINSDTKAGDNVRQAGEDIEIGEQVLARGHRINPADLGLIASLGIAEVLVKRKLRVAFFSTGDELKSVGEQLDEGSIYDSNRYTLYGMLSRLDAEILDMGVVPDNKQRTEEAFVVAAENSDVIITSGGVSVGEADFVKETLQKLGEVNFWKVAMKPGRPLAFGMVRDAVFFGLPGNPVSVMVTFYQFVQPALRLMMGENAHQVMTIRVRCVSRLKKRPGRVEYQRGVLQRDETGELVVAKTGAQGSGILSSMSRANCFIILPLESPGIDCGEMVEVQPFSGLV